MEFCDKLNILMKITASTKKAPAAEISVDPSLISLLRSGRRGIPRNRTHIRNMANYFAARCTSDYQHQAPANFANLPGLKNDMPISAERWPGYNLFVNDGGLAIPEGVKSPSSIMIELRRPEMVAACREHLIRIAEKDGFSKNSRERIKIQLNSLIRELER